MDKKQLLTTVIMAAGKGTRMKSDLPKVLHLVDGVPMVAHVINLSKAVGSDRTVLILGHEKEMVIDAVQDMNVEYVIQEPQLGTGHAVQQTYSLLNNFAGNVLVLSGDVPLLRTTTLQKMVEIQNTGNHGATVLTALFDDPFGYGRVVRKSDNTLDKIVEHKDCTEEQLKIKEINAGIYIFDAESLFPALDKISADNEQKEYYLPDALKHIAESGKSIALHITDEPTEISGVNTVEQLKELNLIYKKWYG